MQIQLREWGEAALLTSRPERAPVGGAVAIGDVNDDLVSEFVMEASNRDPVARDGRMGTELHTVQYGASTAPSWGALDSDRLPA